MANFPNKEVRLVISGVDGFSEYETLDHAIQELILPAASGATGDFYIISPWILPVFLLPEPPSNQPSPLSSNSPQIGKFRSWFRNYVNYDGTRINILTNNITYRTGDDFLLDERRQFAKIVLQQYGDSHMASVFQLNKKKLTSSSSGLHAKAIVAGRRAAYLGSANLSKAGFANNIEFGVLFLGYHDIAGDLLETCRELVTSDLFEPVDLNGDGELVARGK